MQGTSRNKPHKIVKQCSFSVTILQKVINFILLFNIIICDENDHYSKYFMQVNTVVCSYFHYLYQKKNLGAYKIDTNIDLLFKVVFVT